MAPKPPITCHVLDTTTGLPAASLPVTLSLVSPPSRAPGSPAPAPAHLFRATTNADGRVEHWDAGGGPSLEQVFTATNAEAEATSGISKAEPMVWSLRFDAGSYFKGEGFWTEVEIRFKTDTSAGRAHWHVPLLLGPWTYTTYRGS